MTTTTTQKDGDIPPALALIGLALILGLLVYLESPQKLLTLQAQLDHYADLHAQFLAGVVLSFSINAMGVGSVLVRMFSLNRQGGRLALLARNRPGMVPPTLRSRKVTALSFASGLLTFIVLHKLGIPGTLELTPLPISAHFVGPILILLQLSFGISSAVLALAVGQLSSGGGLKSRYFRALPTYPRLENSITLGSTGDDDPAAKPKWETLGRRALNGNILITGSIGSGKTQGTILNYCDQCLSNLTPRPSILAIDPKGTFIPEVLEMIRKRGLEEHVLHLKLGGNVTFNPIYTEKPLRNAQFLNTAQMIRAAAVNFSGKGTDSPFWDLSAFNLMKNTLALSAAKKAGAAFTLNDLYSEMIQAASDPLIADEQLKAWSEDPRFDREEQFNIACAALYFREFEQMEEKLRTGILASATAFLNQFQEYQSSQIFCPTPENTTITSMDEVVDQGKILLFDIASPALARSMGTFIKLHYQQSVLNRLKPTQEGANRNAGRSKARPAVIIADEYQDVASTGGGAAIGDDRFCAKSREANAIAIFATQSLTSLKNSIGKEDSAKELIQNFRMMIALHSTDPMTIHAFQELMGQEDRTRVSRSVSENAHHPNRNLIMGGFEAKDANISESISTSDQKEYSVTGKEFATLSSFESFARIYDGNHTTFKKLYLKPYFLEKKNLLHPKILDLLKSTAASIALVGAFTATLASSPAHAFPNVCTVVNTREFRSCLNFSVGACMCGWPIPRPCAQFSYAIPQTFIEVHPNAKSSYFGDLPGAAVQLATVPPQPYGAESDYDTQSFQAHTTTVPLAMIPFATLPCGITQVDQTCFGAMSEHVGQNWRTGSADSLQPNFLAWSLSPQSCMLKGAATSITGEGGVPGLPAMPGCSTPRLDLPKYLPSLHSACNGWGTFYPRSGVYNGPSQMAGALMIASRIKSLGNEVFHTTSSQFDEKWQMITPQASSCFREGQNVGMLETTKGVREEQRLTNGLKSGKTSGFLFTVWNQVSCCRDIVQIPAALAAIEVMNLTCKGLEPL